MNNTLVQKAFRLRWLIGVAAVGVALGYLSFALAGTNASVNASRRADPAQFSVGSLNPRAVELAKAFNDFPLVWLGEEFKGFRLTEFIRAKSDRQDAVYLIYGTCQPRPGALEPSCVPPLSIVVSAPGSVPDSNVVAEEAAGSVQVVRGVTMRTLSGNPFLWTGGVTITVDANSEHLSAALAGLMTVNHDAVGRAPIKAGESLAPLGR